MKSLAACCFNEKSLCPLSHALFFLSLSFSQSFTLLFVSTTFSQFRSISYSRTFFLLLNSASSLPWHNIFKLSYLLSLSRSLVLFVIHFLILLLLYSLSNKHFLLPTLTVFLSQTAFFHTLKSLSLSLSYSPSISTTLSLLHSLSQAPSLSFSHRSTFFP